MSAYGGGESRSEGPWNRVVQWPVADGRARTAEPAESPAPAPPPQPPSRRRRLRRRLDAAAERLGRPAAAVAVLVVLSGVSFWAADRLNDEVTAHVKGRLSHVSAVKFRSRLNDGHGGISPACGCMVPPADSWRGVTFAGRGLTLTRTGAAPWTAWELSGAEPERIALYGGFKRLDVEAIRVRGIDRMDPRAMLAPGFADRASVVDRKTLKGYRLAFLSREPLHVAMLGDVPVGSWMPFPGSEVELSKVEGERPLQPAVQRLDERYPEELAGDAREPAARAQAYPVGDFLGPDLVFWTKDPRARVHASGLGEAGPGVATVLLIRGSTFSTRVGAIPLAAREFRQFERPRSDGKPSQLEDAYLGASDGGRVTLEIDEPLDRGAYDAVLRRLATDDVTAVRAYMSMESTDAETGKVTDESGWYTESERYPPLPRRDGFNVFGALSELRLEAARGWVSVDDRTLPLGTPTDVALTAVRNLRDADDVQQVPVPMRTADDRVDIEFDASSRISLDDRPQATSWTRHQPSIDAGLKLLGALAAATGLAAVGIQLLRRLRA